MKFLIVGLVLIATLAGLYLGQPDSMAGRVKELESELSKARQEIAQLKQAQAGGKKAGEGQAGQAWTSTTAPAAPSGMNSTVTARYVSVSPGSREEAYKYQETGIQRDFGRLIKKWGLNAEEAEHFKHLIADSRTKGTDLMISLGVGSTPEEKKANSQKREALKKETDDAIRRFLNNDEDYQAYKKWEDSMLERMQIQQAVTEFDSAGETLSGEQRDRLFDLMLSHRVTPEQREGLRAGTKNQAEVTERFLKQRAANDQSILQQSAAFMTPAQLELLGKMQQKLQASMQALPVATGAAKAGAP